MRPPLRSWKPRIAGVHDLILSFPDGYSTQVGEGGMALSAGQRQRIGLARAFYGNPFLIVLDEPTSNLDSEGEVALTEAIINVRRRGGIVVVVAHRPKALEGVDHVLVVGEGRVQSFGPKDECFRKVLADNCSAQGGGGQSGRGEMDGAVTPGAAIDPAIHDRRA